MTATVTAAQTSKNFGYQDVAIREPVARAKNSRPRTVLLAYEDFVRLSRRERRAEFTTELCPAEIEAIEAAQMEPGLKALDSEMPGYAAD